MQHKRLLKYSLTLEYGELDLLLSWRTKGLQAGARRMCSSASVWPSNQEASHQSLCSDTNLASATLWLLFKLACTQGSTLPVNIKSWHYGLKQTWQDVRKNYLWNMRQGEALTLSAVIPVRDNFDLVARVINRRRCVGFVVSRCQSRFGRTGLKENTWWSYICHE